MASGSTNVFVYADTKIKLDDLHDNGTTRTLKFGEVLTLFFDPADLRRLRDAIDAHLGENVVSVADVVSALYVAVEDVIGETPANKPSSYRTSDDADEAFGEGESAEGWRLAEMLRAALSAYDGALQTKTEAAPQPEAPAPALEPIEF